MLKQHIDQLTTDMGFEQPLEANEDGSYSLRLDPDLDINVKESGDATVRLYATLGQLPQRNTEEYLLKTMIANLLGRETGNAALGLDQEGKKVVLVDFFPADLDYKTFHEKIEEFANYADAWSQETKEFIENEAEE
jgi:hypothetical protein